MENGENLTLKVHHQLSKLSSEMLESKENAHLLLGLVEGGERPAEARHVEVARVEAHVASREAH